MVNMVPIRSGGASSVIADENWAESETMETPQIKQIIRSIRGGPAKKKPTIVADNPLITIEVIVKVVLPK